MGEHQTRLHHLANCWLVQDNIDCLAAYQRDVLKENGTA